MTTFDCIKRLHNCGLSIQDATVLVVDFERDNDPAELADYVAYLERLHREAGNGMETV